MSLQGLMGVEGSGMGSGIEEGGTVYGMDWDYVNAGGFGMEGFGEGVQPGTSVFGRGTGDRVPWELGTWPGMGMGMRGGFVAQDGFEQGAVVAGDPNRRMEAPFVGGLGNPGNWSVVQIY